MNDDILSFGGPEFEPQGSGAWDHATPRQRTAYYDRLGWLLRDELDSMLAAGRGFDGRYLRRRKRPRRDGADGPPITPHEAASRARRLLVHYPSPRGVRLSWRASGRLSWRMVMQAHTEGAGRLPVRKVAGLSNPAVRRAVEKRRREWSDAHPWERTPPSSPPPLSTALPFTPRHRPFLPPLPAARPRP